MNGHDFEVLGKITDVEVIAVGAAIRELPRLRRIYGRGRWRKMKGRATIRTFAGEVRDAEVHWYEAHGIGKRDFKVKEP
jgi:hypothetical protein